MIRLLIVLTVISVLIFAYACKKEPMMNIPCPDQPTVTYEGKTYRTVQIGDQCWMAENLNVGVMIHSAIEQLDNDTIEKYCYENDPNNCLLYGGLYRWWEIMDYDTSWTSPEKQTLV